MAADHDVSPSVIIDEDKATATLVIPPGCDAAALNEQTLLSLIRGKGVEVTDFTTQAVRKLISEPPADQQDADTRILIATAQPPVHGGDGSIQWLVDEKKTENDPADTQDNADSDDNASVSFYERCAFVMVDAGDTVAKIHPGELGQDGRDVTGKTLPARSGKDPVLQIDESLLKKADGSLIAQQDGVLYRETGAARIRKYIEIKDYVDFSTGNIDFDGDIKIHKGVRDCFVVKATGDIEVKGLIEAATLEAGRDIHALGGFAGRERGNVFAGGSLLGKYLDNVHGHVKQDLKIDREIINCDLAIEGRIESPNGSIIGGRITPTGEVVIANLGSDAGTNTELVLGSVPVLEPFARKLTSNVESYTRDKQKLTDEQDLINKMSVKGRMTANDKERQTEIMFELASANTNLSKAQRTLDNITNEINKRRRVDVQVNNTVNPNVFIILDGYRYKIHDWVKGPTRFFLDGKHFVYRQGDAEPQPINRITDVSPVISKRNAA